MFLLRQVLCYTYSRERDRLLHPFSQNHYGNSVKCFCFHFKWMLQPVTHFFGTSILYHTRCHIWSVHNTLLTHLKSPVSPFTHFPCLVSTIWYTISKLSHHIRFMQLFNTIKSHVNTALYSFQNKRRICTCVNFTSPKPSYPF